MSREPQTGGTVRVEGTVKFVYTVESQDCNVFTIEELVGLIKADPQGWLFDMWLNSGPLVPDDECQSLEESKAVHEKYSFIEFGVEPITTVDQTETITDQYEVSEEGERI